MMRFLMVMGALGLGIMMGCGDDRDGPKAAFSENSDFLEGPLFLKVGTPPQEYSSITALMPKYIEVFGVHIFATSTTPDEKVEHVAGVLAQYLDNDADGAVDDRAMVTSLVGQGATMVMARTDLEMESLDMELLEGVGLGSVQGVFAEETAPELGFDASLEEVLHLITDYGYALTYPETFGLMPGSALMNAMDQARGGRFIEDSEESCEGEAGPCALPSGGYSEAAWYTYTDPTCSYHCMGTEYFYWVLTTILGAQKNRCDDIADEWQPCTLEALQATDGEVFALFQTTDAEYKMPALLPNGSYEGPTQSGKVE